MEQLDGKVAVVTGAASGIGLAMAESFAAAGMQLALADVDQTGLLEAGNRFRDRGVAVLTAVTDVTDAAAVDRLRDATIEELGAAHVVCANAGVSSAAGLSWELPLDAWEFAAGPNLWGVVHTMRAFMPVLVAQNEGHMVLTASAAGLGGFPFGAPYAATKHAVVGIAESLWKEMAMTGSPVGVTVVCPGWVRTRIRDHDRSRPAYREFSGDDGEIGPLMREVANQFIAGGVEAGDVARLVLDAIRTRRFLVVTNDDMPVELATARYREVVDGADPVLPELPSAFPDITQQG